MLRISKNDLSTDETTRLRLDGSLAGPWVQELSLLCEPFLAEGERIQIDCGGVAFVDGDGITLMHNLRAKGVALVNCSPFITLQLAQQGENGLGH